MLAVWIDLSNGSLFFVRIFWILQSTFGEYFSVWHFIQYCLVFYFVSNCEIKDQGLALRKIEFVAHAVLYIFCSNFACNDLTLCSVLQFLCIVSDICCIICK